VFLREVAAVVVDMRAVAVGIPQAVVVFTHPLVVVAVIILRGAGPVLQWVVVALIPQAGEQAPIPRVVEQAPILQALGLTLVPPHPIPDILRIATVVPIWPIPRTIPAMGKIIILVPTAGIIAVPT
jgi:hypothetical protein